MEWGGVICVTASITIAVVFVVFVSGWSALGFSEMGLDYNAITSSVNPKPYYPGRYYLGVGHSFVRFPRTYQTISFSNEPRSEWEELKSRTSDGLEVDLEISFQYLVDPTRLFDIYMKFAEQYDPIYVRFAQHVLTDITTDYTAYDFFQNPQKIRDRMEEVLNTEFYEFAFANITSFQLKTVSLPAEFESAIKETEVQNQDIRKAQAEQERTRVMLQTQVIQAEKQVEIILSQAKAQAEAIRLDNYAQVEALKILQSLQSESYQSVLDALGGNKDALIDYMKIRAIRDHPESGLTVGIPNTVDSSKP
eukprot:GDKI01046315.1.p1 GENE.GDKI01046315.1~~GDKI01046315.1.p1  ORF type:complete len:321 (-),score=80.82 GDKI01046315.1:309-1229(-)